MLQRLALLCGVVVPFAAWFSVAHAATITVNTTTDEYNENAAACSLREAVTAADNDAAFGGCDAGSANEADTIQFAIGGTFTLTRPPDSSADNDDNSGGDLDINGQGGALTIDGNGYASTIIDGNATDRALHINRSDVTLKDLTVQNGNVTGDGGGIILENGQHTVQDVLVKSNTASQDGGGIAVNSARLTLTRSTIKSNTATRDGGGLYFLAFQLDTVVEKSAIVSNTAGAIGGGIRTSLAGPPLTVRNSTFASNEATTNGGAIHAGLGGIDLYHITLVGNSAGTFGDALSVATGNTIDITSSIIFGSQDHYTTHDFAESNQCDRTIIDSQGNNIINTTTVFIDDGDDDLTNNPTCTIAASAGDQFGENAGIDELEDTEVPGNARYPLLTESNALNAGKEATCADENLQTDQLDLARRGICDVGAVESTCGDGRLQESEGESCEDGNTVDGDGCSSVCALEAADASPICGNSIIESGETCDDGNAAAEDGCSASCQEETADSNVCGNGEVEPGEECDDGNEENGDTCSLLCVENEGNGPCSESNVNEVCCGDGRIDAEAGEFCDDANEVDGDGCSAACLIESDDADEAAATNGGSCSLIR